MCKYFWEWPRLCTPSAAEPLSKIRLTFITNTITAHAHHGVSNYRQPDSLFICLFKDTAKKTLQLRITWPLREKPSSKRWIALTLHNEKSVSCHGVTWVDNFRTWSLWFETHDKIGSQQAKKCHGCVQFKTFITITCIFGHGKMIAYLFSICTNTSININILWLISTCVS